MAAQAGCDIVISEDRRSAGQATEEIEMSQTPSLTSRHAKRSLFAAATWALIAVAALDVQAARAGTLDTTSYSRSTTGASAAGSLARSTDSTGTATYSIGYRLTDTGNDGLPVYVKYRWTALVSGPNGLVWANPRTGTFYNRTGYNTAVTGTIPMTQATLNQIARDNLSTVAAAKLRGEIAVCRDAATDNCSTWFPLTWNTYPDGAFNGLFDCNGDVILVDIRNLVRPAYVPVQSNALGVSVVADLVESADATFSHPSIVLQWAGSVVYPNPLAIGTESFVYDANGNLTDGYLGAHGLTPGKYYAVRFQVWLSTSNAPIVSGEQPTYAWARYTIQNGFMQGTPGDFKCTAR